MPNFASSIKMKAALPVDDNFNMTFEKMRNINENIYPEDYFTMCVEDHKFYTYSKTNTVDPITGKFRLVSGSGSIDVDSELSTTSENPVQNKVITGALENKIDSSEKGVADGIAELDENGRLKTSQLPGGIDEIVNGYLYNGSFYKDSAHTEVITPGDSKIYIDLDSNKQYRWSGLAYIEISASLALGNTSSTAGRGDHTETAYEHSQLTTGNPHNVSKTDVGLGNCDNTADLDKPISTATQTALALKENVFRYTTMPTASGDYVAPVQYIGITTSEYKCGSFYQAVNEMGWRWKEISASVSDVIKYVVELPTSDIENIIYGVKETTGKTTTITLIKPVSETLTKQQAIDYFSKYFTVTDIDENTIELSVYPDLVLSRDGWTQDYKAVDGDIVTLEYLVDTQEILWTNSSSQETSTEAWPVSPIRCTSAYFPTYKYYAGVEDTQELNEIGAGGSVDIDNDTIVENQQGQISVSPAYPKVFYGTQTEWDNLTTAQKVKYDYLATPIQGSTVVDKIENGNMNPVTSNAVAQVVPSDANASNKLVSTSTLNSRVREVFRIPYNMTITNFLERFVSIGIHIGEVFIEGNIGSTTINSWCSYEANIVSITNSYVGNIKITDLSNGNKFLYKSYNTGSFNWVLVVESYSTSETKTGSVWINGKPIYRKVIDLGALPNATTKTVNHNILNLDVIINWYGYAERPSDNGHFPLPYVFGGLAENNIGIFASQNAITITTGSDRSAMNGTVILEYTKTTD